MSDGLKPLSEMRCDGCGEEIDAHPGESYMASTDGRVWHMGCSRSRARPTPEIGELMASNLRSIAKRERANGNAELAAVIEQAADRLDLCMEALVTAEAEARRFAGFYPEGSDGRNTFVIFADKIAALSRSSGT